MRLLRDKIHLDGELLLLVLLQRPNVVRQAPSQDNEFYPLTYHLIIHSLEPMFTLHQVCCKIFNDSIHKVFYIHILYINPVYAMAEILVLCESWNGVSNHCR